MSCASARRLPQEALAYNHIRAIRDVSKQPHSVFHLCQGGKGFRATYLELWDRIMRACQAQEALADDYLLDKVTTLIIGLNWSGPPALSPAGSLLQYKFWSVSCSELAAMRVWVWSGACLTSAGACLLAQ